MSINRARQYFLQAGLHLSYQPGVNPQECWMLESNTWKSSSSTHASLPDLCRWWREKASELIGQSQFIGDRTQEWVGWPAEKFDELVFWASTRGCASASSYMLETEGRSWMIRAELTSGWLIEAASLSHHRTLTMTSDDLRDAVQVAQGLRLQNSTAKARGGRRAARSRL